MAVEAVNFQGNVPVENKKKHKGVKTVLGLTAGGALGGLACDTFVIKSLKNKNILRAVRDGLGSGEGEIIYKNLINAFKDVARNKTFTKLGALGGLALAATVLAIRGIVKAVKNKNNPEQQA